MSDKDWLLNAAAIRAARDCIKVVEQELGVRLKLSHPDFLTLLKEYSELTDSQVLANAVSELSNYSGQVKEVVKKSVVVSISSLGGAGSQRAIDYSDVDVNSQSDHVVQQNAKIQESVTYHGKEYNRWQDGKEFKGLYRGCPRYG